MTIKKILIANRGEIALRVISTCKEMGIKTVTIFADDDKDLPHAFISDESYALGTGPLSETYLNQDKILEIAKQSGSDAIHPGYGFLSENPIFCQKITSAGLKFIGPSPENMRLMGDKITSKQEMESAGVPVIPGYHGDNQDSDFLQKESNSIGYPVMVKATAGGGGRGMRVVDCEENFLEELEGAKREAQNAFGNDKVLIEKFIPKSRHIEVQVFGDTLGNYLHFYERECSIQRRHQKIVEETPSVALSATKREEICKAALLVASSIQYIGAGTVEFMFDEKDNFYFLEMNTRLQVEHPITEMVTGFDLVRLQIMVAGGAPLPIAQNEISQRGHAIELRIYAEDPDNGFLPTVGKILNIGSSTINGIRLDSGYQNGNQVTINYDPMLAKVISWGSDREEAIGKSKIALGEYLFQGVKTNRSYLNRVLECQGFHKGDTFTSFLDDYSDQLKVQRISDDQKASLLAGFLLNQNRAATTEISSGGQQRSVAQTLTPWQQLSGFRNI